MVVGVFLFLKPPPHHAHQGAGTLPCAIFICEKQCVPKPRRELTLYCLGSELEGTAIQMEKLRCFCQSNDVGRNIYRAPVVVHGRA